MTAPAPATGPSTGTVTLVFTDLVGSTALTSALGDDVADGVRAEHFHRLRGVLAGTGGTEVKNLGDGLMLAFSSASEAVAVAVGMQQAAVRQRLAEHGGVAMRVGISSGDALCEGDDWFGTPVNEAARLCGAAAPGQILIADVVRLLAGSRGGHRYELVDDLALKGLPDPVRAYAVRWAPQSEEVLVAPPAFLETGRRPIVGREESLHHLLRCLAEVRATSTRQLVIIGGVAGIGKTRLVTELVHQAVADGVLVLGGRADEQLAAPYRPWVEALEPLASTPVDSRPAPRAELARLIPSIGRIDSQHADDGSGAPDSLSLPIVPAADADTERLRVFEAFDEYLSQLAGDRGAIIVLDDVQWADDASILLARHLVRSTRTVPLLVVATARSDEIDDDHQLRVVIRDLRRLRLIEEISLSGLGEEDTCHLVAAAADTDVDPSLARWLHRHSEGNPFFAEELLAHLGEVGALRDEAGSLHLSDPSSQAALVAPGILAVLERRLARLPSPTIEVLESAAVTAMVLDLPLLAAAQGVEVGTIADRLEPALQAGLIVRAGAHEFAAPAASINGEPAGRGVGGLAFSHGLVRVALDAGLSVLRRARISSSLAEALQDRCDLNDPASWADRELPDIARHLLVAAESGLADPVEASLLAERAAHRAMALSSPGEGASWYRAALAVLGWQPGDPVTGAALVDTPDNRRRANLLLGLADALSVGRDAPEVWDVLTEAVDRAAVTGEVDTLVLAFLIAVSCVDLTAGFDPFIDRITRLLDERTVDRTDGGRALAEVAQGINLLMAQHPARVSDGDAAIEAGVSRARALDDPLILAMALAAEAGVWAGRGRPRQVLADLEAAETLLEGSTVSVDRLDMNHWRAYAWLEAGDRAGFDAAAARLRRWADDVGSTLHRHGVLRMDAVIALMEGRFEDAREATSQMVELPDWGRGTGLNHLLRQWIIDLETGVRSLPQHVAELSAFADGLRDRFPVVDADLAAILARLDRQLEAQDHLDRFMTVDPDMVPTIAAARSVYAAAEAAARLGDRRSAEQLMARSLCFDGSVLIFGGMVSVDASASVPLGQLAFATGDLDESVRRFEHGLEVERSIGAAGLVARTSTWLGRALVARSGPGDLTRADSELVSASSHAESIGAVLQVEDARAVLAQLASG